MKRTTASSNQTEVAAAWIVALALIAAIVVHFFLPVTPPRLGHGVADANSARVQTHLSGGSVSTDSELPLVERAGDLEAHAPRTPQAAPRPAQ